MESIGNKHATLWTLPAKSSLKAEVNTEAVPRVIFNKRSVPMDTIILDTAPIAKCALRNGFKRINVQSFMSKVGFADRAYAAHCMVESWATMLNLGRKGDAGKLWEMGKNAFGEAAWEDTAEECLKLLK